MTQLNQRTKLAFSLIRFIGTIIGVTPTYILVSIIIHDDGLRALLIRLLVTVIVVTAVHVGSMVGRIFSE